MVTPGIIVMWYGSIVSIPNGWVLCDGNNGTPDLRDRFIVGAGDTYAVDEIGGDVDHRHDFEGNGHSHTLYVGNAVQAGAGWSIETTNVKVGGTTQTGSSLPPFHALCFIMKT